MWTCPKCGRIFKKKKQPHSCKKVPLDKHFAGKDKAKGLFDYLLNKLEKGAGECKVISIPCCIHLFGNYDFLAALPKKDGLEIRIALGRKVNSKRLVSFVQMSKKVYKNCFKISSKKEIDNELLKWLRESYYLKST
jgi:hypothetical protein